MGFMLQISHVRSRGIPDWAGSSQTPLAIHGPNLDQKSCQQNGRGVLGAGVPEYLYSLPLFFFSSGALKPCSACDHSFIRNAALHIAIPSAV